MRKIELLACFFPKENYNFRQSPDVIQTKVGILETTAGTGRKSRRVFSFSIADFRLTIEFSPRRHRRTGRGILYIFPLIPFMSFMVNDSLLTKTDRKRGLKT